MGDLTAMWRRVLGELQLAMPAETYQAHLAGSKVIGAVHEPPVREPGEGAVHEAPVRGPGEGAVHEPPVRGPAIRVVLRSERSAEWVSHRLAAVVARAAERHGIGPVEFVGPEERAGPRFVDAGPEEEEEEEEEEELLDGGEIMEAVREQRVSVTASGQPLQWTDFYIKVKVAFRKKALRSLKGAPLSVFLCLALHVDRDGVAHPGIEAIMRETGYSRSVVCNALSELVRLGLMTKRSNQRGADEYRIVGYAWFGQTPAPSLWEEASEFRK